jgi:hypothetical protein
MDAHVEQAWKRAATAMMQAFKADLRNGRMLADPWSRAAHSMVQSWRIRLSQPPTSPRPQRWRPTWEVFAHLAAEIADAQADHALRSAWHRWAASRVTPTRRYVPKRKRTWQARPSAPRACSLSWTGSDPGALCPGAN